MSNRPDPKLHVIMLIDDTPIDLYFNTRLIENCGKSTTVNQFNLATEAMEFLQTNKDNLDIIPDIIFLDIFMPGMTGFEFLHEYAKLPSSVKSKCKIHILSSSFDPEDIRKADEDPYVLSYIEKPLTSMHLDFLFQRIKSRQ